MNVGAREGRGGESRKFSRENVIPTAWLGKGNETGKLRREKNGVENYEISQADEDYCKPGYVAVSELQRETSGINKRVFVADSGTESKEYARACEFKTACKLELRVGIMAMNVQGGKESSSVVVVDEFYTFDSMEIRVKNRSQN